MKKNYNAQTEAYLASNGLHKTYTRDETLTRRLALRTVEDVKALRKRGVTVQIPNPPPGMSEF